MNKQATPATAAHRMGSLGDRAGLLSQAQACAAHTSFLCGSSSRTGLCKGKPKAPGLRTLSQCSFHLGENHKPVRLCGHSPGRLKELLFSGRHRRGLEPRRGQCRGKNCSQGALKKKLFFQTKPPAIPLDHKGHIHGSGVLWSPDNPGSSPALLLPPIART